MFTPLRRRHCLHSAFTSMFSGFILTLHHTDDVLYLSWCCAHVCMFAFLAAAGSSCPCVGLCQPQHTPCSGHGLLWPSLGLLGFLQVGKETPNKEFKTVSDVVLTVLWLLDTILWAYKYGFVSFSLCENGGNTLCVVDDSNDHVLSVWDWQREDRLAEVKVC